MATYIKTLKEDNGDITYPQTKGSAVLLDSGSDLETVLAAKADASTVNQKITVGDVQSTDIVANAVTTAKIADSNVTDAKLASNSVTTAKIADGAVTQDKIMGGWKLIGEANGSGTNIPLYLDKIYTSGTFKIIASGQCNAEGWLDLRAYRGNAVGNATLIKNSWSTLSFAGTYSTFAGASDDSGNYIASGTAKAYYQFTLEATSSSHSATDWRSWNFNYGCGTWGRIGTTREAGAYNKTAFSLTGQYTIYSGHIEVWWHE